MVFQVYMLQISNLSWVYCSLNITCLWFFYVIQVGRTIGFSQIPDKLYHDIFFMVLIFGRICSFKDSMNLKMVKAYKKVKEVSFPA